jgi:hypothetical protein
VAASATAFDVQATDRAVARAMRVLHARAWIPAHSAELPLPLAAVFAWLPSDLGSRNLYVQVTTERTSDAPQHRHGRNLAAIFDIGNDGLACSGKPSEFSLGESCSNAGVVDQLGELKFHLLLSGRCIVLSPF